MPYYTYILSSKRRGTFYTGITNDLPRRVFEHKEKIISGFTSKHDIKKLVYYEIHEDVKNAICREKLIKKWRREIKISAIEKANPEWEDLYFEL